jgi:Protein of unknown function (DUF2795)
MIRGMGGHSPSNVAHYLKGVDFPARKQDLQKHAKKNEAPEEVVDVLEALPDETYNNMADVMKGFGEEKREQHNSE